MTELEDALTDIRGVGDATAEEIMSVVDEHGDGGSVELEETLRDAVSYYEQGDYGYAEKYLYRALELVE